MVSDSNNYIDTLDYLSSLVDYSLIPNLDYSPEKFDLRRMRELLVLMDNPQTAYPIVHIDGTKGKGSTAAMMASVLQAAGYKVGLFISPYLFDFCEQIQVNRKPIPQADLLAQVEALKPHLAQAKGITTFEAATAIAFDYFRNQKVDIAIIEAGLGGRTDATNVVNPLLSVITSISYDHMGVLGTTIEAIASEIAGIIKSGHPVAIAHQVYPEAKKILVETAERTKSEVLLVENEIKFAEISHSLDGQVFSVQFTTIDTQWNGKFALHLLGKHQIENAATAITALHQLTTMGFSISKEQLEEGLRTVLWPCRFEVVSREPLIVLDGAHNVDSAIKLKQTILDYLPGHKIILVFGASSDKDISGMFEVLFPAIDRVIFTKSPHPRAAEPAMLVKLVQEKSVLYETFDNVAEALASAKTRADKATAIVVAGSLFIAASARETILDQ